MGLIAICDYVWLLSDPVRWLLSVIGYALTAWSLWWFGLRPIGDGSASSKSHDRSNRPILDCEKTCCRQSNYQIRKRPMVPASLRRWLQESVASRTAGIEVSRLAASWTDSALAAGWTDRRHGLHRVVDGAKDPVRSTNRTERCCLVFRSSGPP